MPELLLSISIIDQPLGIDPFARCTWDKDLRSLLSTLLALYPPPCLSSPSHSKPTLRLVLSSPSLPIVTFSYLPCPPLNAPQDNHRPRPSTNPKFSCEQAIGRFYRFPATVSLIRTSSPGTLPPESSRAAIEQRVSRYSQPFPVLPPPAKDVWLILWRSLPFPTDFGAQPTCVG